MLIPAILWKMLRNHKCNIVGALMLWAGRAAAQTNPSPAVVLAEIVVTATNPAPVTAAVQLPAPVTPLRGADLERAGVSSALELPAVVPNFTAPQAGLRSYSDNYVMRGLGNTEFLSDAAVALYVDDVPFGDTIGYSADLLEVERVEVFRGPQGTRFGNNSEAGVINITTRQAQDRVEARASAGYASFDAQTYRASVRGPLLKGKLHFGLAGQYERSEGFIRNAFRNTAADETEGLNGRAFLRWTPDAVWEFQFTTTGDHFDDGLSIVSLSGPRDQTQTDVDTGVRRDANSQSLRVRGNFQDVMVTSITSRQQSRFHPFQFDPDFSPLTGNTGIVNHAQTQWSEEVRLAPRAPGEFWTGHGGLFFSTRDTRFQQISEIFIPPAPIVGRDEINAQQNEQTSALFGEATCYLSSKLELTLGLRLDCTKSEIFRTRVSTFAAPAPVVENAEFYNAAPKLTLAYHVTDQVLGYASSGIGFKPGGYSPVMDTLALARFDTERVWATELGVKTTWLEEKIRANAAVFYNAVRDYQVEQSTPTGFDIMIVNAPRGATAGGELELGVELVKGLELAGFVGYTDARLERYTDPFTGNTFTDIHPPFVAEYNAGVSFQYRHAKGWYGRVGYTWIGETFYDAQNRTTFRQAPYGLLNARLGWESARWDACVFGENLTEKDYYLKKIPSLNAGAPGQPLTVGVTLAVKF
jgi:iron complex outermembrane receptor protein